MCVIIQSPPPPSDFQQEAQQQQNDDGDESSTSAAASVTPTMTSAKELAALASTADFGREVERSSDLKALLPKQKMRFMQVSS